jgi:hypothetical protein
LANYTCELPCIGQPGALNVLERNVQLENQVKVHIVLGYLGKVGGAGDGKRLLLAHKNEVLDACF